VIHTSGLPALNATSACLLTAGYVTSTFFLTSYVIYHAKTGSHPFSGQGPIRGLYFSILITHVVLAVTILPLALTTAARGLRAQYGRHVQIARWTLPLWLYVSVTGVVIYLMLYRIY
jgi:putative membrane protein